MRLHTGIHDNSNIATSGCAPCATTAPPPPLCCPCRPAPPRDAPAQRADLSSHLVLSSMCDNGTAATAYCLCSPAPLRDAPARRAGLRSHLVLSSMCDSGTAAAALLPPQPCAALRHPSPKSWPQLAPRAELHVRQRHRRCRTAASAALRRLATPQPVELASARTSWSC